MSSEQRPPGPPGRPPRAPRYRRWVLLLAFLLSPIVAELLLRAAGDDVVAMPPESPYDYSLRATTTGDHLTSHRGPLAVELCPSTLFRLRAGASSPAFRINAQGFRGPELEPRRPDRRRIVVLGASTAFGLGLPSDDDTVAARTALLLGDAEVVNAGVPMFMSGQQLCMLATQVMEIDPDVVVFFDGWTDCFDWWENPPRPADDYCFNRHVLRLVEQALLERQSIEGRPWFMVRTGLGMALEQTAVLRAIRRRTDVAGAPLPPPAAPPIPSHGGDERTARETTYVAMRDRFVRHLLTMRDLCRGRGIRFVATLQPELGSKRHPSQAEAALLARTADPGRHYLRDFAPRWQQFVAEVRTACGQSGLEVHDLGADPALRLAEEACYADYVHLTAAGAARTATALVPLLR